MAKAAKAAKAGVRVGGVKVVKAFTDSFLFKNFILICIIANAVALGLEAHFGPANPIAAWSDRLDMVFLAIFSIELMIKFVGYGPRGFFANGWNVFDLIVVGLSYISVAPAVSALRTLRVLRVFRLVSNVPQMRRVVEAMIGATPGIMATMMVLALVFFIGSVMATTMFGETFPEDFGNLGLSALTLFQLSLFDDWGATVRALDAVYPWAWVFILGFTVLSAFAVLNLFIGVIVDAIQDARELETVKRDEKMIQEVHEIEENVEDISAAQSLAAKELDMILTELRALRQEVAQLREARRLQ